MEKDKKIGLLVGFLIGIICMGIWNYTTAPSYIHIAERKYARNLFKGTVVYFTPEFGIVFNGVDDEYVRLDIIHKYTDEDGNDREVRTNYLTGIGSNSSWTICIGSRRYEPRFIVWDEVYRPSNVTDLEPLVTMLVDEYTLYHLNHIQRLFWQWVG